MRVLSQDRNVRETPDLESPTARDRLERAMVALDHRFEGWREALRQDAVESISRVGAVRMYRGIRVPVYDMVAAPLVRGIETLSRHFVEEAAPIVSAEVGRATSELEMVGRGMIEPLEFTAEQVDLVIARGAFEGNIAFRRRFEGTLIETVDALYQQRIRTHLEAQLKAILAAWA